MMKNKEIMSEFLNSLNKKNKLTAFFKIVFDYEVLNDYNYISRFVTRDDEVIIDIYDNVLDNRFNRYIFNFKNREEVINVNDNDDVIVTVINVNAKYVPWNNLMRLAYLFSDYVMDKYSYAKVFLPDDILYVLKK